LKINDFPNKDDLDLKPSCIQQLLLLKCFHGSIFTKSNIICIKTYHNETNIPNFSGKEFEQNVSTSIMSIFAFRWQEKRSTRKHQQLAASRIPLVPNVQRLSE